MKFLRALLFLSAAAAVTVSASGTEKIRKQIPKCSLRKYTVSEIINAIIDSGFTLKRFDEHPAWEDKDLPGEFTAIAVRE